ncbi:MAG TPA: S8 family serine peptidase, partial [Acidimicrobiales bacterium]|nr:S8 family serine peptidase [Acidimicrobiales bacterium]
MVWGRRRRGRGLGIAAAAALLFVGAAPAAMAGKAAPDAGTQDVRVIVMSTSKKGDSKDAGDKTRKHHGDVVDNLDIADAVVADVSPDELADLANDKDVVVVPNFPVSVAAASDLTGSTRAPAAVFPATTGAATANTTMGLNGQGVTVAVLDTGITKLADFAGRVVGGVDLSGEGDPFKDSYGHGTFVSGLIAGNGASSQGQYVGEAPKASLASIKVAGASGVTDLATVISGVQWAVKNQKALNIGVLNISLGAIPFPSSVLNPLDQAVEAAWNSGIVVVASAGNLGPTNGTITSPGDDPLVVTVGAIDDQGTASPADDTMSDFSSVGPTAVDGWFKPDLVTSGRSVVSLRAPGSTVDLANPLARVGDANFVGSGTSFSAAITSGAAAILRQAQPGAAPDKIKGKLLGGAMPGPVGSPFVDGFGSMNVLNSTSVKATLKQTAPTTATPIPSTVSLFVTGAGSAWNGSAWNGSAWNGSAWNGSSWNGSAWNGSAWNGSAWNGSAWNGSAWNSALWDGSAWNGSSWNGSAWNGSAWNGSSWNG